MMEGKLNKVHSLTELKKGDRVSIENPGRHNTVAMVEGVDDRSVIIGGVRYYKSTGNRWGRRHSDFNIIEYCGLYLVEEVHPEETFESKALKEKILEATGGLVRKDFFTRLGEKTCKVFQKLINTNTGNIK